MTPREPSIGEVAEDITKIQQTLDALPDRLDRTFLRIREFEEHARHVDRQFEALKAHADGARATALWAIGLLGAAVLAGIVAILTRGAA